MDNRSLSDDLSKLFSSENEDNPEEESTAEQDSALIGRLKELSGNAQELRKSEQFLGKVHSESTRGSSDR
jgi:hypothetical protein